MNCLRMLTVPTTPGIGLRFVVASLGKFCATAVPSPAFPGEPGGLLAPAASSLSVPASLLAIALGAPVAVSLPAADEAGSGEPDELSEWGELILRCLRPKRNCRPHWPLYLLRPLHYMKGMSICPNRLLQTLALNWTNLCLLAHPAGLMDSLIQELWTNRQHRL
ncbi:MAG TPA: hypothetical protein V6C86_17130 [Oculatellaceae cyanobacterium]